MRIFDKSMIVGKDNYIVGKTSEIINEDNLKKYFGINTKILDAEVDNRILKSVIMTDNFGKQK